MMKLLLKLLKSVATMVSQCLIRVDEWVTRQLVSQPGVGWRRTASVKRKNQ